MLCLYINEVLPCEQPTVLNPLSQKHTFGPVQLPREEQLFTFSQETTSQTQHQRINVTQKRNFMSSKASMAVLTKEHQ